MGRRSERPSRPWKAIVSALAALLVIAVGVGGYFWLFSAKPDPVARELAADWQDGHLDRVPWSGRSGVSASTAYLAAVGGMKSVQGSDYPSSVSVRSVHENGDTADATLTVTWDLRPPTAPGSADGGRPSAGSAAESGAKPWSYTTHVVLRKQSRRWRVEFSPRLVHPALGADGKLSVSAVPARRGDITGARGKTLFGEGPIVTVGIEPRRVKDLKTLIPEVASLTDVDADSLRKRVEAAADDAFVDVITLRRADYEAIADKIKPLPGTVFRTGTQPLSLSRDFARALLGTVGQASAEDIQRSRGAVAAGDLVGKSGLQQEFNSFLAGRDGIAVKAGDSSLFSRPPVNGQTLETTIDVAAQKAADAAVAKADHPSSLVAIDVHDGDVLAVANGGKGDNGVDRALYGKYPPGSVFKIASGLALLDAGVQPGNTVPCPATVTVNGKKFKNAEHEKLGDSPFSNDFAQSCNTAFVGSASKVSSQQITDAAASLGLPDMSSTGTNAFGGSVPVVTDDVDHAASMIGQGKVLASPIGVATMATTVAAGKPVPPKLVTKGTPDSAAASDIPAGTAYPSDTPSAATTSSTPAAPADPASLSHLKDMMRKVVLSGTGSVLAKAPGDPIYGKTGTAEFGTDDPPQTHAWFAGFQGTTAFSVVVEAGGFGATAAVPVAGDFLKSLGSR